MPTCAAAVRAHRIFRDLADVSADSNSCPIAVRPHFRIRSGPEAGTYVRVGSTNRRADADLVGEMQRFARGEVYDERPMRLPTPEN
jgi:hypothetical protein